MLIRCFLNINTYAHRETMLSKAFPIPNNKAIPVSVGTQIPVAYKIKAMP